MTNSEAIQILQIIRNQATLMEIEKEHTAIKYSDVLQACNMAIRALRKKRHWR